MSLPIEYINDFYLEVARGNVSGFSAREIVGTSLNTALGETTDVWNAILGTLGHQIQVATAALLYISSSSAADITQTVTITGVDANYDEITEDIALDGTNGQTIVAGTKSFLRVNSAVLDAACAGKVYVYYVSTATAGVPDTKAKVQAAIDIAALQAYNAIYTVPRNKNLYMTSLRYASCGSTTTHDVILCVRQTLYGGSETVVKTIKYVDAGTTLYTDDQVQFTDQPVLFPAKSEFKVTTTLTGGTALNVSVLANFIEEDITAVPSTVDVLSLGAYTALLTSLTRTNATMNYWLIGLETYPDSVPLTANLDDVLATITGAAVADWHVAADTDVAFDVNYFVPGVVAANSKLIVTTNKAIFTIMRCVDSAAAVHYVQAPVNTLINLGNVKKTSYLTS